MQIITSRERDLGGLKVRRILPDASLPMVGPFIFFDHIGPTSFLPGQGLDVRPHPHINLATVTYLFEGAIQHRDSLGSNQLIEPGAINWMVAGKGIVHSERTPDKQRQIGDKLNGIQCWIALPEKDEDMMPSFTHYPADTLPIFEIGQVKLKLLLGNAFGLVSPVAVLSDLFYIEAKLPASAVLPLSFDQRELAIYVVKGDVNISGQVINPFSLVKINSAFLLQANTDAHVMLLGGLPLGKRYIYWNFVSSAKEKIEVAKLEWRNGPKPGTRFASIPQDDNEFIPLPEIPNGKAPGTIM